MRPLSYKLLALSVISTALAAGVAKADTPDSAYQVNVLYTNELFDNTGGGLQTGAVDSNNVDVSLQIDAGKAFGLSGGTIHLEGFYADANSFSDKKEGSLDDVGSIDTNGPQMWRVYQAYYDQQIGKTDVRFGIYDLETEFSNTKPALLFLNKNFSWNTTFDLSGNAAGTIGPGNFPDTPLALRVRQTFGGGWSAQVVVADAADDDPNHPADNAVIFSSKYGVTTMGELDYEPTKHTKLMAGLWGETSQLQAYGPLAPGGALRNVWDNEGGYVGGSTRLIQGEGRRGLDAFFTLGVGKPEVTAVNQSFNAGFTYTGPFAARPDDKLGLAFAENHGPDTYLQYLASTGAGRTYSYEDSIELTYRAHVLKDFVTLQPDVQYITHPGYEYKNSLVVGLHVEVSDIFNL